MCFHVGFIFRIIMTDSFICLYIHIVCLVRTYLDGRQRKEREANVPGSIVVQKDGVVCQVLTSTNTT